MNPDLNLDLSKGSIAGHFRTLAVPGAVSMLFSTLYNIVDMFFAGLLSTSAQAALALGFQAFFIAMAVGLGLGSAMAALVGNSLGEKDHRSSLTTAVQGISFGAIASRVLAILGLWYGPALISLVSEPGHYRDLGIRYFVVLSLALPGFLLAFGCNGILQAHGDAVSMQRALIAAFFANIALNPILIYGIPGMWNGLGFDGLAVSTVISQSGVMLFLMVRVLRRWPRSRLRVATFLPRMANFSEISFQVMPTALSWLLMFIAGFVVQFALKNFGEHAIAGYGIAIRLEQILLLPIQGVTLALLPIAAQNFGAKDFNRVREATFYCWKIGFFMAVIACPIMLIAGRLLLEQFTDSAEVLRVGFAYLIVESFILPFYMFLFAVNSFLQALKRPVWIVWINLYRHSFGIAFFVWLFVSIFEFNETGVWLGVASAVISGCVFAFVITAWVAKDEIGGLWMKS